VFGIVRDRIKEDDCKNGFILDGLPRTSGQVTLLDSMLAETNEKVTCVIALEIADDLLTERITGRWIHKASGRSYHVKTKPPKSLGEHGIPSAETMLDDETNEPLEQRADDTETALKKRLEAYHAQSKLVLDHYEPSGVVHRINADASMDDVWNAIEALSKPAGVAEAAAPAEKTFEETPEAAEAAAPVEKPFEETLELAEAAAPVEKPVERTAEQLTADLSLTPDQMSNIVNAFKSIDKNGNGELDEEEFIQAFREVDPTVDVERARDGFKTFDKNRDGVVSFEEFATLVVQGAAENKKSE